MRRTSIAAVIAALALPAAATAQVSTQTARRYERAYHAVALKLGARAPGRNIVRWGLSNGRRPTDARVMQSIGVLHRMLYPPRVVATQVVTRHYPQVELQQAPQPPAAPAASTTSTAPSGLVGCIIQHESGGNPQATNGQYAGIGQWSPAAWAQDGGTRYAPTPLGASYSQQLSVLNGEGAAGMQQQQGQYDGC